ncbi:MAG: hypothetical protein JKY61_01755 [Planctomycetes bacterium]|nr:hypothetical protein [Planctomycetota bacterium]
MVVNQFVGSTPSRQLVGASPLGVKAVSQTILMAWTGFEEQGVCQHHRALAWNLSRQDSLPVHVQLLQLRQPEAIESTW